MIMKRKDKQAILQKITALEKEIGVLRRIINDSGSYGVDTLVSWGRNVRLSAAYLDNVIMERLPAEDEEVLK